MNYRRSMRQAMLDAKVQATGTKVTNDQKDLYIDGMISYQAIRKLNIKKVSKM